jgi:hypothetical protein
VWQDRLILIISRRYEANLSTKPAGCTSLVRAIAEVAGPGVSISDGFSERNGARPNFTSSKSGQQSTLDLFQLQLLPTNTHNMPANRLPLLAPVSNHSNLAPTRPTGIARENPSELEESTTSWEMNGVSYATDVVWYSSWTSWSFASVQRCCTLCQ